MARNPLLIALLTVACCGSLFAQAIIVDHTCADADRIPDAAIAAAAKVRSVMLHASVFGYVGQFKENGLDLLQTENPRYNRSSFKFIGRGHPGAEAIIDEYLVKDLTSDAPGGFVEHTAALYDVYGDYLDIGEKWKTGSFDWPRYRDAMLQCEAKFPAKRFIWATTTCTGKYNPAGEPTLKAAAAFNASVRDYCRKNGRILLDISDIMSHDPAGNPVLDHGYESFFSGYTTDKLHPDNPLGKKQLARAYWHLMARIAGWKPAEKPAR